MDRYEGVEFVDRGRFASVFKARDTANNQDVALKKMWVKSSLHQSKNKPKSYLSRCISREIKILRILQDSAHIIGLRDTFSQDEYVIIVLEYMNIDLHQLLTNMPPKRRLLEFECKRITTQLFSGLDALHTNNIVHRDLKPANILFDESGTLKIADLGQARIIHSSSSDSNTEEIETKLTVASKPEESESDDDGTKSPFSAVIRGSSITLSKKDFSPSPRIGDGPVLTNEVGTRWYKSPELLYGTKQYDFSVDIWSAGCILAEMLQSQPLFCGETDIDQLCKIFNILGTINLRDYPDALNLPDFNKIVFNEIAPKRLNELWPTLSDDVIRLIESCLRFNPHSRITSVSALSHHWFGRDGTGKEVVGDGAQCDEEFSKLVVTATGKLVMARKMKMDHFHDNDAKDDGGGTGDDEAVSITSEILDECDLLDIESNPI